MSTRYAEYLFSGLLFGDSSIKRLGDGAVVDVPKNAVAYRTFERQETVVDGETLRGEAKNHSPWRCSILIDVDGWGGIEDAIMAIADDLGRFSVPCEPAPTPPKSVVAGQWGFDVRSEASVSTTTPPDVMKLLDAYFDARTADEGEGSGDYDRDHIARKLAERALLSALCSGPVSETAPASDLTQEVTELRHLLDVAAGFLPMPTRFSCFTPKALSELEVLWAGIEKAGLRSDWFAPSAETQEKK